MKYLGTNGDRGAMKVFKVIAEEAPYFFNYTGTAANAVQPPYPLKARSRGAAAVAMTDLALIFVNESLNPMEHRARAGLAAISTGDDLKAQLGIVRRPLRWTPLNGAELRRRAAQRVCETGSYNALVAAR